MRLVLPLIDPHHTETFLILCDLYIEQLLIPNALSLPPQTLRTGNSLGTHFVDAVWKDLEDIAGCIDEDQDLTGLGEDGLLSSIVDVGSADELGFF